MLLVEGVGAGAKHISQRLEMFVYLIKTKRTEYARLYQLCDEEDAKLATLESSQEVGNSGVGNTVS